MLTTPPSFPTSLKIWPGSREEEGKSFTDVKAEQDSVQQPPTSFGTVREVAQIADSESYRFHLYLWREKSGLKVIGYHIPAVRRRDLFYAKLEREREED